MCITSIYHIDNVYKYVSKMTVEERLIEVTRLCFVLEAYTLF